MRIDKVKHREANARIIQPQVNQLAKQGSNKEQIEKALQWVHGKVEEGKESYVLILPAVAVEPSHLSKGFIAYFICPCCKKRVRIVYMLNSKMACRICHLLTYKKQDRRQIEIQRLIWDRKLAEAYMITGKWRYIRKALEAEYARDEIKRRGYQLGEKIINGLNKR